MGSSGRKLALVVLGLAISSAPAAATGSLFCEPIGGGEGPILSLTVGHSYPGGVIDGSLEIAGQAYSSKGQTPSMQIAQAWVGEGLLFVDLADPDFVASLALLRARFEGDEGSARGMLRIKGREYPVSCSEQ